MKKVLFTATVDSHILQFHLPFLKLFKEKGYEVHVATNGNEEIPYCDVKHVVSFERSPLKINNLKAIKQLRRICDKEKFDIIHTHTPMGSVVTRLAARKARKKHHTRVIYTAHGFHFFKGASIKNWLIFYPVEKYLAKYTDTLITINQEDYNLAKNKFSKRCRDIEYVPGVGIDEEKFNFKMSDKEKSELRRSLGLKDDDFVMIYPAELSNRKRQIWLINTLADLLKKYKDIHLLLPGKDSLNGKCQELVSNLKLENQIHFLGYRKDIPKLLKISNLALSSANQEGLPVNIMEAMYVGLPIVASNCRGNRDLVVDGKNGFLIELNDNVRFCKCVEIVFSKKNSFGDLSRILIDNYMLDKIINEMEKIYEAKKRILHILASNIFSGAENVACTIINNTKDIYDEYYCSLDGSIREKLEEYNIDFVPIQKLNYFNLRKVINKYRPDIIHAHDNKATVFASFFHKRCKIISHIHGNNKIMNSFNFKTLLFNFCSKNVSKFIWVSDSSLNDYYFKNNIINKSIVMYNIVNKEELIAKSNQYESEKYDIIFLGRLGYPKNVTRLIEIIKLVKEKRENIKVAIVGDGPDKEIIKDLITKYKLNNNIKMFGYQSNPYPILKNSKILVMTSIYEGTPMCALEAQALGKPIVATPVDGLRKIVKNGYNGYLSENNDDFAKTITELLTNKTKYSNFSNFTQESFKKYNDLNNYCNIILNIYVN